MDRRRFLITTSAVAAAAFGRDVWSTTWLEAGAAVSGPGPYGALGPADANGLQLPDGFTSRIIATTGAGVAATAYEWHQAPDGGACFPTTQSGWVYVSNSEVGTSGGGASAVRFTPNGSITDAYRVLSGTSKNCAGGPTPWGTWLSCEENGPGGRVYECDPQQQGQGVRRDAMGAFNHEAVAVDTGSGALFLTEDDPAGRLYRFLPSSPGNLSSGSLWAASWNGTTVSWVPTSPNGPDRQSTTTAFNGGEGMWAHDGSVYFTTKGDRRVWELVPATNQLAVLHDCVASPSALNAVDNVTAHPESGDLFVAEDGGNMELCILAEVDGVPQVAAFARIVGHAGSEVTGPAFSPDGTRLYFSSQRGADGSTGVTYEVTGPFRTSVGGGGQSEVVIVPTLADTFVRGGTYAATVNGTATLLQVSANANKTYERISYVMFDLADVEGPVTEATLRIMARLSSGSLPTLEVVGIPDTTWSETTTNWNNRPADGPLLASFPMTTSAATWYEADVASWVEARRAAGANRVALAIRMATSVGLAAVNSREMSSGRPELVVRYDSGPPPPPPPNVGPTAAFTQAIAGRRVDVTSTSTDPDGSLTSQTWDFGDGATATGATASHTYAADGTYTITLMVTDDDGAADDVTRTVTVTTPTVQLLAADVFGRTVTNGFGSADVGGNWSTSGTAANFAVNGGMGRITLPSAGLSRAATLASVSAADVELAATQYLNKAPAGSGTYIGVVARKVGNSEYRLRIRISGSSFSLQLLRVVGGVESSVATAAFPVSTYTADTPVRFRFRVTGSGPTMLAGKVWFGAGSEPASWQIQATDTSPALQGPGGVGVHAYLSSTATNIPITWSIDDLEVRPAP